MALPMLNVSLSRLRLGDRPLEPTSMNRQEGMDWQEGVEHLPPNYDEPSESGEEEEDDRTHYERIADRRAEMRRQSESNVPSIPIPRPPVPVRVEWDPTGTREMMARRMMLTMRDYTRGFEQTTGDEGYWRAALVLSAVDEGRAWRREQGLRKFMVPGTGDAEPQEQWRLPFRGPLTRAVHDLRAMHLSREFVDFWDDPRPRLDPGRLELYERMFSVGTMEWLDLVLQGLESDLHGYIGGTMREGPQEGPLTEAELRILWSGKHFMTFYDVTTRVYGAFCNAILFNDATTPAHKRAVALAMHTAYRFTQYHIDEWEMSRAARIDEIDVHIPDSVQPIKARYQIPKEVRARYLCDEMLRCPFSIHLRERTDFPPLDAAGAKDALAAAALALNLPPGRATDFVCLREVQRRCDAHEYGYQDPFSELERDVALCFEGARQWLKAGAVEWVHPAVDAASEVVSNRTLAALVSVCARIFVEGWVTDDHGNQSLAVLKGLPTQLGRIPLLRRLDDFGVQPTPEAPEGPEVAADVRERNVIAPSARSVARLFELLNEEDRARFGAWAARQVREGNLPGETTADRSELVIDFRVFGWRQVRQAFLVLGINIGVELAERTRVDGRTERLWAPTQLGDPATPVPGVAPTPTPDEQALGLLSWEDRAFRIVALAWIDQEERRLMPDRKRRDEYQSQMELAAKRWAPGERYKQPGFDRRRLSLPVRESRE